jgi:hypothetical protein
MQDSKLWTRLQKYQIARDGPDFATQVAKIKDIGRRAPAAIEEYKRFLYLTQVSQGPATPSVTIDSIWHLHMTFTRDYWEVLCGEVLGRDLHHDLAASDAPRGLHGDFFAEHDPRAGWKVRHRRRGRRRVRWRRMWRRLSGLAKPGGGG